MALGGDAADPRCMRCGDQCVVRACRRLSAGRSQRCGNCAKCARRLGIERQRVEVRLRLLQMRLACRALFVGMGDMRPHRQLGQRDRADHGFVGKSCRVADAPQQDHRRGVEHPPRGRLRGHSDGSMTVSMSRRSASRSMRGNPFLRSMSSTGLALRRGSGRNSATARPSRVTITRSPRSTRSSTSPPLLRRSRTVTDSTAAVYRR